MRVIAQVADVSPVKPGVAAQVAAAGSDDELAALLAELEGMSEDDAARLLGADAPEGRGT